MLVSYVFIDELKLDWFDFDYWNCALVWKFYIQVKRNCMKLKRQAEKAAKEADKVRKRQQYVQRKEGKLPLQF